jgi:hypothetical protein
MHRQEKGNTRLAEEKKSPTGNFKPNVADKRLARIDMKRNAR